MDEVLSVVVREQINRKSLTNDYEFVGLPELKKIYSSKESVA